MRKDEQIMQHNWEFVEDTTFNPQRVEAVLNGVCGAYVVRGMLPSEQCAEATDRFLKHSELREDPVIPPIAKLGYSLYEFKEVAHYFEQSPLSQASVDVVFTGTTPLKEIATRLHEYFIQSGIVVRPLQHEGKDAFYGVLRKWWGNQSGLAALPHEDFIEPKVSYDDLETNDIASQLSVVCCLTNGKSGGTTRIYNRRPTRQEFENPNNRQGYGFTHDFVSHDEFIDAHLEPGDILIFAAHNIHSVDSVPADGPPRITQQMFMGQLRSGDIIYWS